jgi:hypothetical protein
LRRRMVRALAADPELFERLLGVHARVLPLGELGAGGTLRLAWRLAERGRGLPAVARRARGWQRRRPGVGRELTPPTPGGRNCPAPQA